MSRRDPIAMRNWTTVQRLLRRHNIGHREIAEDSGVPPSSVSRVLSRQQFASTRFETVLKVRRTVAQLLRDAGEPSDANWLWHEYDQQLEQGDQRHAS